MFCIDYLCVNEKYMFIHEDRQPHFQILFLLIMVQKRVERYKRKLTMLKMKKKTDTNSVQNTAQKIED